MAVAFCTHWVFKYGPPRTLLSDNGPQFASKFFQAVCLQLGTKNVFTTAYHPQTNGQVERYNRTLLSMLRNYVNDNQDDWDVYASALTYAYNTHVHRTTGTTPFDLILSRPPPPYATHHSVKRRATPDAFTKQDFLRRITDTIDMAGKRLHSAQARYKRNFDRSIRKSKRLITTDDYVYLDNPEVRERNKLCLLYTSDAADD